jgi:hypothetical protein
VEQIGQTLRLSFKPPLRATDGRRLTKPIDLEIFRQLTPPGDTTVEPFVPTKPWLSLPARELGTYTRRSNIVYDDRFAGHDFSSQLGTTFSFMVVSLTRGFRGRERESSPSNIARIKLLNVSPPPQQVSLTQVSDGLGLRWSAPSRSLAGGALPPLAGYQIYRTADPRAGSYALLARTPYPQYDDRDVRFNQTYRYQIRVVFKDNGYIAESEGSSPVGATLRDIFPPPIPGGLMAVYTGRSVQLIWKSVVAPNFAGYNIFRKEPGKAAERLNQILLRSPAFSDSAVVPQHQYSYWVTSVSVVHHESAPSEEAIVDTR